MKVPSPPTLEQTAKDLLIARNHSQFISLFPDPSDLLQKKNRPTVYRLVEYNCFHLFALFCANPQALTQFGAECLLFAYKYHRFNFIALLTECGIKLPKGNIPVFNKQDKTLDKTHYGSCLQYYATTHETMPRSRKDVLPLITQLELDELKKLSAAPSEQKAATKDNLTFDQLQKLFASSKETSIIDPKQNKDLPLFCLGWMSYLAKHDRVMNEFFSELQLHQVPYTIIISYLFPDSVRAITNINVLSAVKVVDQFNGAATSSLPIKDVLKQLFIAYQQGSNEPQLDSTTELVSSVVAKSFS